MTSAATSRTLIMTATYNEIENLPYLVETIFNYVPDAHLLVVDDNSPDGTGKWCQERSAAEPRLHCLQRSGKLGLGTAIVAGMQYAIDQGYDYLLNMDADFSHHPRYLAGMIEGMENGDGPKLDVMIGSRYVPGGGTLDWPLKRKVMSRTVNLYARWLLGLKSQDCSGGYRCYRVSMLQKIDLQAIRSSGYSFQEEVLWLLKRAGARIGETPIVFADREKGASKINSREAVNALRIIFRLGVRNWLAF